MVCAGEPTVHPDQLIVVGDALAAGRRDPAGVGLAIRIAHRLRIPGTAPVLPIDLSAGGGLRFVVRRMADLLTATSDAQSVGVVLLGLEDAGRVPLAVQWLDGAESIVQLVRSVCDHTVVVTPPPILDGRTVRPWSSKEPRRWARRTPEMLIERVKAARDDAGPVSVVSLSDMPEKLRADDVWPTAAGYDWIADQIAGELLRFIDA